MSVYDVKIIDRLLNKYERSKSFIGSNTVCQNFTIKIVDLFPEYADDSNYDLFRNVNLSIESLEAKRYLIVKRLKNGVVISVTLNVAELENCYKHIHRTPKKLCYERLLLLLENYCGNNELLDTFCHTQMERISQNKKVEHFDGDFDEYESILKTLTHIFNVHDETFKRDFSVRVLGDSKLFEKIQGKVESILFTYGDYPEKESILEDLNIIKNPGHVYFKGNGIIEISGQKLDFSKMNGDFAISSSLLKSIESIQVLGNSVITIENLTTFNAFVCPEMFAIYLGGYHNSVRREFIKKIYEQNDNKSYYHYGDIDAGGFYILEHLKRKTGVKFQPYRMDCATLQANMKYTKPLTDNDRKRLTDLLDLEYHDTIEFMLEHNCKLEQEALD